MNRILFGIITLIIFSCMHCAAPEKEKGFLHVDKNGRYFAFEDGTSYVPIGFNKFRLYLDDEPTIDSLLQLWSDHGVNYIRVWMGISSGPEKQVGVFDEERMSKIDYIINTCEKYGVYLSLCFWNENALRTDQSFGWNSGRNAYNILLDSLGTTDDPEDLKGVDHIPTWNAMKNRYAVFVNHWKDHEGIMMWDLVNDGKKTDEWKTQMYDCVQSLDPNDHIIGFQYNTGKDPAGEMDCGSVRVYDYNPEGNDPEEMTRVLFDRILEALPHGDPVYCGEGRMHCAEATDYELERFFLHTLWGPMAVGAAGNLHAWVCKTKEGRWPDHSLQELTRMKKYSDFCKTIDWSNFNSKNLNHLLSSDNPNVKAYACGDENQMLLYLLHDDPEHKFNPISTTLNIDERLKKSSYKINWFDIRTGEIVQSQKIKSLPGIVEVPVFSDGIFAHLIDH